MRATTKMVLTTGPSDGVAHQQRQQEAGGKRVVVETGLRWSTSRVSMRPHALPCSGVGLGARGLRSPRLTSSTVERTDTV